jgi:hypothetical protein
MRNRSFDADKQRHCAAKRSGESRRNATSCRSTPTLGFLSSPIKLLAKAGGTQWLTMRREADGRTQRAAQHNVTYRHSMRLRWSLFLALVGGHAATAFVAPDTLAPAFAGSI